MGDHIGADRIGAAKQQHSGGELTECCYFCQWCYYRNDHEGDRHFLTMTCQANFRSKRIREPTIKMQSGLKLLRTLYNSRGCPVCCDCDSCNQRVADMLGNGGEEVAKDDYIGDDDYDAFEQGAENHPQQQQQQQQLMQQQQQQQQQQQLMQQQYAPTATVPLRLSSTRIPAVNQQAQYNALVQRNVAIEESSPRGNARYRLPAVFAATTPGEDGITTPITTNWPTTAGGVIVHESLFFSVITRAVRFEVPGGGHEEVLMSYCNCR